MIFSYPQYYLDLYTGNISSFRQWLNEIHRVSDKIVDEDERLKFRGDNLEIFSEMFFNLFQNHPAFGVRDYTPVKIENDYGVDATGVNVNGHKCAIQVKYRSNPEDKISYADIARTFTSGVLQLGLIDLVDHDHTVYLFTNTNEVTSAFTKVLGNKAVLITKDKIEYLVDGNKGFWDGTHELILNTLDNTKKGNL